MAGAPRAEAAEGPLASTASCFAVQDEGLVSVRHKLVRRVLLHHVDSFDALAIHIVAVYIILAPPARAAASITTILIRVFMTISVLLAIHILLVHSVGIISAPHVILAHIVGVSIDLTSRIPHLTKVIFVRLSADRDRRFMLSMLRLIDDLSEAAGTRWHLRRDISPDWRLSSSALLRRRFFEAEVDGLTVVGLDDTDQGLVQVTELDLLIDPGVYIVGFTGLNRLVELFFAPVGDLVVLSTGVLLPLAYQVLDR